MKIKILVSIICIINLSFIMEANALFSITHFNLGTKIIEKLEHSGETLSESEKAAFLSGMVYADIGRFKFDKETGITSDSDKFADTMSQLATSLEEQWFVKGFKVHIMQDNETGKTLSKIFGNDSTSYKEYLIRCALLDGYFLGKSKLCIFNDYLNKFDFAQIVSEFNSETICKMLNIPEYEIQNFTDLALKKYCNYGTMYCLTLYDKLIKATYNSFGIKVSLNEIQIQSSNIIFACAVLAITASEKIKIDKNISLSIEKETQDLCDRCVSYLCN